MQCLHHITLSDEEVANKRVVVIGDVHGCYEEMMSCCTVTTSLPRMASSSGMTPSSSSLATSSTRGLSTSRFEL
jgi:hypothetical protein